MKLHTRWKVTKANTSWRLRDLADHILHPRRKLDREGWVAADRYTLALHFHGGPLDGTISDIVFERGEQVGFGPYIEMTNKHGPLRYERRAYPDDWYEAEGADTHLDLIYAE